MVLKTANFQLFLKVVPEENANVSSLRDRKALFMGLIFTLLSGPQKLPPSSVSANQSACTVHTLVQGGGVLQGHLKDARPEAETDSKSSP